MGKSKDLATRVGIDDNATSTAITISSSELVGIGTTSPYRALVVKNADSTNIITESTGPNSYMKFANNNDGNGNYIGGETTNINLWTQNLKRLNIDGSGCVTLPYQPAFSTRGTNYTQATGSYSTVKPATVELNVGSHYNSSTGVWTVPVAGNYLVVANGLAYPTGTGGSGYVYNTSWYKNGTQWEDIQDGEYNSNHSNFCNGSIIPCAANDTLDFRFYRSNGSAAAYVSQFLMYGYLLG